jgi:hypothetical protein
MKERYAIQGHDGEDSHSPHVVVATFDTREQAEAYVTASMGPDPTKSWPYREDSLLHNYTRGVAVTAAPAHLPPHNPPPEKS